MQSLAERFYEIGEPYAGGLFEQPDRSRFFAMPAHSACSGSVSKCRSIWAENSIRQERSTRIHLLSRLIFPIPSPLRWTGTDLRRRMRTAAALCARSMTACRC